MVSFSAHDSGVRRPMHTTVGKSGAALNGIDGAERGLRVKLLKRELVTQSEENMSVERCWGGKGRWAVRMQRWPLDLNNSKQAEKCRPLFLHCSGEYKKGL